MAKKRVHEIAKAQGLESKDVLAALKSAGVPVFWVGLPSIRGPKSTSDVQYLDDLYRASAEKAFRRAAASCSASASSFAVRTSRAPFARASASIRAPSSATTAG